MASSHPAPARGSPRVSLSVSIDRGGFTWNQQSGNQLVGLCEFVTRRVGCCVFFFSWGRIQFALVAGVFERQRFLPIWLHSLMDRLMDRLVMSHGSSHGSSRDETVQC